MSKSVASIDDSLSETSSYDSDDDFDLAQQEWEESVHQLVQVLSVVLLPYLGKWLGRRWSYWAYERYTRLGLRSFIGGRAFSSFART